VDEDLAQIVELRFFGGLEHDEIAAVLGVSRRRCAPLPRRQGLVVPPLERTEVDGADRWRRIETLFDEAASLPSGSATRGCLARAARTRGCGKRSRRCSRPMDAPMGFLARPVVYAPSRRRRGWAAG
jgi:hypothetical protein